MISMLCYDMYVSMLCYAAMHILYDVWVCYAMLQHGMFCYVMYGNFFLLCETMYAMYFLYVTHDLYVI